MATPTGWTHEEAKKHDIVERLFERCATYDSEGLSCPERMPAHGAGSDPSEYLLPRDILLNGEQVLLIGPEWCERCTAAMHIQVLRKLLQVWP